MSTARFHYLLFPFDRVKVSRSLFTCQQTAVTYISAFAVRNR